MMVPKQPPQPIEEVPPEVRPEGENVAWIPGYWGWDDDRKDFLWVSGVWRVPPPAHRWVPGYWQPGGNGFQWVSGYWMPSQVEQVLYLPAPPASLDNGPVGQAPGPNYFWISGHHEWRGVRYVWIPGYYAAIQPNWIYVPANYVWTPRGYVFVPAHWDYTLETRGLAYSPVYFSGPVTVFRPSVCVDVGVLSFSLFARPSYCHYYFGDYYDGSYVALGFSPWYTSYRYGYDPMFAYYRYDHIYLLHEPGWDTHLRGWGEYYRAHPDMRPPHTYAAQVALMNSPAGRARPDFHQLGFVQSSRELARDPHAFVRVQAVSASQAAAIRNSVRETREFGAQRQNLEARGAVAGGPRGEERVNYASIPNFHSSNLPGSTASATGPRPQSTVGGAAGAVRPTINQPPKGPAQKPKAEDRKRNEDRRTEDRGPLNRTPERPVAVEPAKQASKAPPAAVAERRNAETRAATPQPTRPVVPEVHTSLRPVHEEAAPAHAPSGPNPTAPPANRRDKDKEKDK
jgi:hypothetical protein